MITIEETIKKITVLLQEPNVIFNPSSFLDNYLEKIAEEQRTRLEQEKYDRLNQEAQQVLNCFPKTMSDLSNLFTSFLEQNKIDEDEADLIHFIKTKSHLFLRNTKKKVFSFGSFYYKSFLFQKNSSVQNVCRKVTKDFRFYYFGYGV